MKTNIQTTIKIIFSATALFAISCASPKRLVTTEEQKIYMQEMYTSLTQELSHEAEVAIVEDSVKVIFVSGVLFKVNEPFINKELYPFFTRFAKVLNNYANTTILITGHADNTGDEKTNIELSQKRADNAKQLLQDFEVNTERIYTLGHGSALPIENNNTSEGRAKNRRVEFVILYNCKQ